MKIIETREINRQLRENAAEFVKQCEKKYADRIMRVAQGIKDSADDKPIILLSGPSGSGKTTSALRLEELLDGWGNETHTISMDEYFFHSDEPILDENGNVDYESPYRVDMDLLNEHLEKIANCEPVDIPHFDFAAQRRTEKKRRLVRKKGELVILEGIHALNPMVTGSAAAYASGVYISVRTRLQTESGNIIHPSRIRLLRRLIRDKLYRGREFSGSLDMFDSVERGENLYIMPYKKNASYNIDSFIGYEVNAYEKFVLEDFKALKGIYPALERFEELAELLGELEAADPALIPARSLIREFIGGSTFRY